MCRKGPIFQISTVIVFSRISFRRMAKVATRADFLAVCSGQEVEGVGRIGGNTGPGRRKNTNFFTTYTYMYLGYQYRIVFDSHGRFSAHLRIQLMLSFAPRPLSCW